MRVITVSGDLGKFKEGTELDNIQDIAEYIRLRVHEGRDEASFTILSDIRIRAAVTACDLADGADPNDVEIDIVNRIATETARNGDDDDKPSEPDALRAQPRPFTGNFQRDELNHTSVSALAGAKVPDDVLRQVADLGRVCADQHNFYFSCVRHNVQEVSKLSARVKGGLEKKKGEALLSAARALCEVLGTLNTDECEFLEGILGDTSELVIFDKISGTRLGELKSAAYQLLLLFSLVTGAPHPGYPYEGPQPRQRGKNPGTLKNAIFHNFVCALLIFTRRCRGAFTLEKNIPSGTLIEAIEQLAPYLPNGFVPDPLSGSALQRLKTWCEQIPVDLDDVEYGLNDLWMYSLYPRRPN